MSNKKAYLGIDLGTTNSTVSIVNIDRDGRIVPKTLEVEQVDEYGLGTKYDEIVPSALFVDENGVKHIGVYPIKMMDTYPERVLKEVKRFIGYVKDGETPSWKIDEESYSPEVVSSYVLKKLKKEAEKYLQHEVDDVVITVPANFNFNQVGATRTAAKLAGFKEVHTLAEPTAAIIDYLNEERQKAPESRRIDITKGKLTLLVADIGGGTSDISIMEVSEDASGTINIQELSLSQYTEIGGVDFDKIVVKTLLLPQLIKAKGLTAIQMRQLSKELKVKLTSNLTKIAENAKKAFTKTVKARAELDDIDIFEDSAQFDSLKYREMTVGLPPELTHTFVITKGEYDKCIRQYLYAGATGKDIETPIINAIETAKVPLSLDSIDQVFLVGGMTNYPEVQRRIYEIFNKRIKPISSINPMLSVSRGAAVFNYYGDKVNIGDAGSIVDVNILPGNIYIDVITGDPVLLLEKGTDSGSSKILDGRFEVSGKAGQDSISEMELKLITAERANSMNVTELKSAILKFRRPVKSGSKISIKAEYTKSREVIVSAWLTANETEKIDVVIGTSELSKEREESIKKDTVR